MLYQRLCETAGLRTDAVRCPDTRRCALGKPVDTQTGALVSEEPSGIELPRRACWRCHYRWVCCVIRIGIWLLAAFGAAIIDRGMLDGDGCGEGST